jgi:hypothetical protein
MRSTTGWPRARHPPSCAAGHLPVARTIKPVSVEKTPGMPHALQPSTLVKRSDKQVSCVLDEEVALLNLDRALYFGLNGAGAYIWHRLQEPRSVANLCRDVVAHFDVSPEVCRDDVGKFLVRLLEEGLIDSIG